MTTSQTIIKIAPALLKAQKTIGAAKKDAKNPFFKSSYADLGAVMEACKEALNENGITVLQPVGRDEFGAYVETMLLHESGEFITDRMPVVAKSQNDPQAQGSAVTYARRYSLQSMVFIPAEDDDAERATNHRSVPPVQSKVETINPEQNADAGDFVKEPLCEKCGAPAVERRGTKKDGKQWHGIFCSTEDRTHTQWLWD